MFSDGAGSQFKNRFILSQVAKPALIHPNLRSLDWSFFGTAHGKGPVDGVGGTVKRAVWRRILQEKVVVNNAEEFYECAKESCPNILVLFVQSSVVADVRAELEALWAKEGEPRRIPATHDVHFVKARYSKNLELATATVSPFLNVKKSANTEPEPASLSNNTDLAIETEKYYAVDYITRFYIVTQQQRRLLAHEISSPVHMKRRSTFSLANCSGQ